MYSGEIAAEFKRNETNEHMIGLAMCGGLLNGENKK